MFDFYNCHKFMLFTNGCDVIHITEEGDGLQVTSGQPMCIFLEDKQTLINMFFDSYKELPDNENDNQDLSLYPMYTSKPIIWSIGYTREGATEIENLLATTDFVRINAIKHPDREEYAIPFMQSVFDMIPDELPAKQILFERAVYKTVNGQRRTIQQMINEGWKF